MYVVGLTIADEDANFETGLQEFGGDPAQRVIRQHKLEMKNRKLKTSFAYKNFVGPEIRYYENLQLGALAAYLVRRGLEDRNEQARKTGELANNSMSVAIVNECVELTLLTTEHLTIASLQNWGSRLVDDEYIEGMSDPVYDEIITSIINPAEDLSKIDEPEATVFLFPSRDTEFDDLSIGAVAGS